MKSIRSIVAVVALAVVAVPSTVPTPFDPAESGLLAQGKLSQLRGMQELKSWFNTFNGRPRLILLLSPT
jgi:hypothetical protein